MRPTGEEWVAEVGAGVAGADVPVQVSLPGIGEVLPGGELAVEDREVVDAPVQASAGQGAPVRRTRAVCTA